MSLTIERVEGRRDLHRFVTFPWKVYRGDPHWVPPLIGDTKKTLTRHPFHEHATVEYFLARREDQIVGRIAAIENHRHNEFHEEKIAFFGFFEALADQEAAIALLDHVVSWARARGLTAVRGPANFSSNEEWGLLVEGFDSAPVIMMTYNPERYRDHLEAAGFRKVKDLLAYWLDHASPTERIIRTAERMAARRGVTVRTLNMKRFAQDVDLIREVYNEAWERNWGFVPMTEAEIAHMAKELRPVVKPELVLIAEREGRPVGFSMALPDYNQAIRHANGRLFPFGLLKILWHARRVNRARVLTLGLVPGIRRSGVEQLLYLRTFQGAVKLGIVGGEMSWILEDNHVMRQGIERLGGRAYKTYRICERETGAGEGR